MRASGDFVYRKCTKPMEFAPKLTPISNELFKQTIKIYQAKQDIVLNENEVNFYNQ